MSRHRTHGTHILQEQIRRQFGSVGTTRFVRSLPPFRVEGNLPDRFNSLLLELERVEGDRHHRDPDRRSGRDG